MLLLKWLVTRQVIVYAALALLCIVSVDWSSVHYKRSRYLLGIFYNGDFKNCLDAQVYGAYNKRVHMRDAQFEPYVNQCQTQP